VTERITARKGGRHSPTTTEMTGRNRALNAARNGQKRQRQLLRKERLADGNPFLHLTALANGRPLLHFTPTSSSWLNQVERWFAKITEQRIRRGVFKNVDELITAIDDYIAANNQKPKPFVWTATTELILDRVTKLCKRTTRSPH
jgi:hypothetical protein